MNLTHYKIIREPILSLSNIKNIPNNKEEINIFINTLFENNVFNNAIFLASPELLNEWKKQYPSKYEDKFILSILKYYIRSLSNTVPFGHFASYSIINDCNIMIDKKKGNKL